MATVRLESVAKYFGATRVLEDLDLEIADGEFAVIVGPSGCGKTTLLRLVAGIESLTAGSIMIDDRDVARVRPGQRDVAMVFQDYALYPHMTVEKNLSFGLRARRAGSKDEIRRRVREVATSLQIEGLLDRKPGQLSGGQRQRVALGRAMIREPQVYLMDEPLSNLDAALRVQVREDLIEFHRSTGATIAYVTHDQIEAMTMGQRVIVMNDGVIQQQGPPSDIYERPANLFVATFVGSPRMNTLEGTMARDGSAAVVTAGPLAWRFDDPSTLGEEVEEVVVGFRPESVVFAGSDDGAGDPSPGDRAMLSAHLEFVEHLGHEALVRLDAGSDRILARVATGAARSLPEQGRYEIARSDVHLFDAASGRAIAHGDEPVAERSPGKATSTVGAQ